MNKENNPAPRCPYCGAEMNLEDNEDVLFGLFADEEKMYWYQCNTPSCGIHSPANHTKEGAYKAATKRASRWISVEDALPAEKMHVIGFDTESKWDYPLLYFRPDTKEFLDETYDYKPVSITHWMPYPDAPKEESDNE